MKAGRRGTTWAILHYGPHEWRVKWRKFPKQWGRANPDDYGVECADQMCVYINTLYPPAIQRSVLFAELWHIVEEHTISTYSHAGMHTYAEGVWQIIEMNSWLKEYLWAEANTEIRKKGRK